LASRLFAIREPRTPVSRALLIAQFATQRKQVPLIYAVVIAETLSIIYVLPDTLSSLLRVGVASVLIAVSILRIVQWRALSTIEVDAQTARRHLARVRLL